MAPAHQGSRASRPVSKIPKRNGPKPPPPPPRTGRNMAKSSSSAVAPVMGLAWALIAIPVSGILTVAGYLLHGYGVI